MMMAIRGDSADAMAGRNNKIASRNRRTITLVCVAMHHRPGLQMLDRLGQLMVGFAVE